MSQDTIDARIGRAHAIAEAAVLEHGRLCVVAAAEAIRQVFPTASAAELDVRDWREDGVRLLLVRDTSGRELPAGEEKGWDSVRIDAEMYLVDALEFADPTALGWRELDPDKAEHPAQDRFLVPLPSEVEDEHGSGPDVAAGERSWELISKEQAEEWAGRALTDKDMDRLDDAIPHSTIPDAIGTIVSSFDPDEDDGEHDDEVDSFAESGGSA